MSEDEPTPGPFHIREVDGKYLVMNYLTHPTAI